MTWVGNNLSLMASLFLAHVMLALPAVALSVAVAIPLGWLAHRSPTIRGPLLQVVGLLYAIPSLALFLIVPSLFGLEMRGSANIIVVLAIYGVAILVRTVTDAFDSVPADVLRAADACGYSLWRRFWSVDLPLSLPVTMAGVRVVVVSTISLVTVGSVIGVRSLGTLFTDGFQRGIVAEVVAGLVLTVLLALAMDGLCVLMGHMLTPWTKSSRLPRRVGFIGRSRGALPATPATTNEEGSVP